MPNIDRHALWIATALCLARAVLGLIFFMAGVYKVFLPFVELGAGALVLALLLLLLLMPPEADRSSLDELCTSRERKQLPR